MADTKDKNSYKANLESIRKQIKSCSKADIIAKNHCERLNIVKNSLNKITTKVGCSDYLFILGITELYERFGNSIFSEMFEILDTYYIFADKNKHVGVEESVFKEVFNITRDDAFAAFYYICHHYYREFDSNSLWKMLSPCDNLNNIETNECHLDYVWQSEYKNIFHLENYPLIFELLARYYSLQHNYNRQLYMARMAIKSLDCKNYGAEISFANAVCSILEDYYLYGIVSSKPIANLNKEKKEVVCAYVRNHSRNIDVEFSDITNAVDEIDEAQKFIEGAILFNPEYPKYHYIKARLMFYSATWENFYKNEGNHILNNKREIEEEINLAIELEENRASSDVDRRIYAYNRLLGYVNDYIKGNFNGEYHRKRKTILGAKDLRKLSKNDRPNLKLGANEDYVFISYSSENFKPVYCDLLEMERTGIRYWYDIGTHAGIDWKEDVRNVIKGSSAVVFYMSAQSIASAAVMDELNYALQLKKTIICINLSGNSVTSKTLKSIIRSEAEDLVNRFSSNTFKTICTACPDYIVTIQRDHDPLNVYHIEKLRNDLLKNFPNTVNSVISESLEPCAGIDKTYVVNGETFVRPTEDYLICDGYNKIYLVADGITRSHKEYESFLKGESQNNSITQKVSKHFCDSMYATLKEMLLDEQDEEDLFGLFKNAFVLSNEKVKSFLDNHKNEYFEGIIDNTYYEKPGCVAIAACILGNKLYYGSVGDCMGILVRGNRRIIFSDKQTDYAFKIDRVERDRKKLYEEYVNIPENLHGYGVVNGDKNASEFFKVSRIELEEGDVVFIVSDGISDLIQYGDINDIINLPLENLIDKARDTNRGDDDKAIIRLKIN